MQNYVLVVDSGVGGLNVLRRLCLLRPSNYVYVADHKFCPYGTKTAAFVAERVRLIADRFSDATLAVIACNTASCALAQADPLPCPTVNAVSATCDYLAKNVCGDAVLLATTLTVQSRYYDKALRLSKVNLRSFAADELVRLAEKNLVCCTDEQRLCVEKILPAELCCVRTAVLGCTHFDVFADVVAKSLPVGGRVVLSSECVANAASSKIEQTSEAFCVRYFSTDRQKAAELYKRLGLPFRFLSV